ncbi:MAG: hypothetical protein H7Y38_19230 [Armatimonadetes bacterium]|nr:hypothetical protein [Armatimonadota bacterium]
MLKLKNSLAGLVSLMAAVCLPIAATAQKTPTKPVAVPQVSRANLAKVASFTVTSVLIPNGGSKVSQVFRVEVKGNMARLDYSDPATGAVRYLANSKGVFFVIPANKTAVKQDVKGGVEQALQVAFAQANEQLKSATKIGETKVGTIPTDIYKNAATGTTIYVGKNAGFRLPVKTTLSNEGGSRTVLVTNIKLNPVIADSRFALPAGVRVMDGGGGAF